MSTLMIVIILHFHQIKDRVEVKYEAKVAYTSSLEDCRKVQGKFTTGKLNGNVIVICVPPSKKTTEA